jgi:hypothetical protein
LRCKENHASFCTLLLLAFYMLHSRTYCTRTRADTSLNALA